MKKIIATTLSAVLAAGVLSACGASNPQSSSTSNSQSTAKEPKQELNLFTWAGMFPDQVIEDFEKETGIQVNYSNFDTDETMLQKLSQAKGGDYDLIIADDYIIQTAIEQGLVAELDKEKLPNLENVNPIFQSQFYDPENRYTVPYGAGVQTIVYNPETVDFEITGYEDLWNPALKDNLAIIGNYRVINGMALKTMGESYNTEDISKIESAGKKLLELAPNIRLIKDENTQDDLISGEVGAAVMYTSQVTLAKMANPDLKVVFPKEGIGLGIMAQFIPSQAPNPDAAHQFINYILQPEVAKQCFEHIGYYSTNKVADALISEEYKEFLTLPESFTADATEMIAPIPSDAEEAHVKVWTEFKNACGQ